MREKGRYLELVIEISQLIGTVGVLLAAAAAIWVAVQGQRQLKEAQKARYDQLRPIIVPTGNLGTWSNVGLPPGQFGESREHREEGYDPSAQYLEVSLHNAGAGVALDVEGVVFRPQPQPREQVDTTPHHLRYPLPLEPGEPPSTTRWLPGGTTVQGSDTIAGHTLYAPPRASLGEPLVGGFPIDARLTLTYRDVFNRKHASILDFSEQVGWILVFTDLVTKELLDLEREHLMQAAHSQAAFQNNQLADRRGGQ